MIRTAVLFVLLLASAGCQRTLFENPPIATAGCDADLVGEWHSLGDKRSEDGELVAIIGPACDLVTVEHRGEGDRRSPSTQLHTGRTGGVRYLWVDAGWANRSFDIEAGTLDEDGDVYLYAWTLSRDVLRLAAPPHAALAHKVIDKDIPGEVLMHDDELVVRVTGTSDEIKRVLSKHRLFRQVESMRFRRAPEARR